MTDMASIIKRCDCPGDDWDGCPHPWVVPVPDHGRPAFAGLGGAGLRWRVRAGAGPGPGDVTAAGWGGTALPLLDAGQRSWLHDTLKLLPQGKAAAVPRG
jgi:hypothetical protein